MKKNCVVIAKPYEKAEKSMVPSIAEFVEETVKYQAMVKSPWADDVVILYERFGSPFSDRPNRLMSGKHGYTGVFCGPIIIAGIEENGKDLRPLTQTEADKALRYFGFPDFEKPEGSVND